MQDNYTADQMNLNPLNLFKGSKSSLTITGINLKLQGQMHSLKGMVVNGNTFDVDIPFHNKSHTDMLTGAASFKTEKAKPFGIKGIEVADPFKLVTVTPKPPLEVLGDQKVDFKLTIEGPAHNYTGPLTINFVSDVIETIHVEITKTILSVNGKKTTIETSSRILNLQKGHIFSEKVQLYKALSYGNTVSKIEIEKPFTFVSSDPKLPIQLDNTNGYILNLYIQAPESPYAGVLEIKIS